MTARRRLKRKGTAGRPPLAAQSARQNFGQEACQKGGKPPQGRKEEKTHISSTGRHACGKTGRSVVSAGREGQGQGRYCRTTWGSPLRRLAGDRLPMPRIFRPVKPEYPMPAAVPRRPGCPACLSPAEQAEYMTQPPFRRPNVTRHPVRGAAHVSRRLRHNPLPYART